MRICHAISYPAAEAAGVFCLQLTLARAFVCSGIYAFVQGVSRMKVFLSLVFLSLVCLFLAASFAAAQQSSNPVTDSVKLVMQRQAKNLPAAVDEMPADKFSFKPTPQQEPFAHIAVHVAESNISFCSKLGTVPAPPKEDLSDTTPKDKLVAATNASFDYCGKALATFSDKNLGDETELFGGRKGTKATLLFVMVSGWADHYAQAAMYLRLSGLLPPTAKPAK